MRPEENSRRLFGITRSKGKMYEFNLAEEAHIAIPEGSIPEQLLLLTVGTLGDVAAEVSSAGIRDGVLSEGASADLHFASSFFDALIESRLSPPLKRELFLLASAAYYLVERPGSSLVMANALADDEVEPPLERLLHWLLAGNWSEYPTKHGGVFGALLDRVAERFATYFYDGTGIGEVLSATQALRKYAYRLGDSRDLLQADLICSVVNRRISSSSWLNLPQFSELPQDSWLPFIQKASFPKELWPAQMRLGEAGLFSGASGLVQMPTSAGKTRSVEMIIRSAFLSGRASLAVVVAPFRALCHEINQSLREAFGGEEVKVDELSDALQLDYLDQFEVLFGIELQHTPSIIVLTPEKLLYVLRQSPNALDYLGLVVYDEGHQFDTGYRGITYELLLTEIKQLLPEGAQTVLISAVIQNADVIADWLLGDGAEIVSGEGLLPTARSIAFASWLERLGQMMFYEDEVGLNPDYFVPRVIGSQELELFKRERRRRVFPERDSTSDISLYLGLRLAPNGAVAIFCGRKDSAQKMVSRGVEIFARSVNIDAPAVYSDQDEVLRLRRLYALHFGENSDSTKGAGLGIYAHHRNIPHGIRLALEYAMQEGKIKFVACTSTLAQGVNIPIRYLIVSGTHQGQEQIKTRDFHNLMGRAGRAGMHTEGLVIFSNPKIFDRRNAFSERWRFESAKDLIDPAMAEPTSSSLLSLVGPLSSIRNVPDAPTNDALVALLLLDEEQRQQWSQQFARNHQDHEIDEKSLFNEISAKRSMVHAVESYLMAHRGESAIEQYREEVVLLVQETLAFKMASDQQKTALSNLFVSVCDYVDAREPSPTKQSVYAKTLLGIDAARNVESWVDQRRDQLLSIETNEDFLDVLWDMLAEYMPGLFATTVLPDFLPKEVARMWLSGASYERLVVFVLDNEGSKPAGNRRQKLNEQDVIGFCENSLGFDYPLGIAAVSQFLFGSDAEDDGAAGPIMRFQKALKYGIPDELAISTYESGVADRLLSQWIANNLRDAGYDGTWFDDAMTNYQLLVRELLAGYPSYFTTVINSRYGAGQLA